MDKILKVLVVNPNANHADNIIKTVKSCGFAVRATVISSVAELAQIEQPPHLVIHSTHEERPSVQDLHAYLCRQNHQAPIIALTEDLSGQQARLLEEGAHIVLPTQDNRQLQLISARLAEKELYIESLKAQANDYTELDQRYRQVLDSSHDAICYIHAGLHVYANNAYLELFNINGFEQASVLSILELVPREDQAALKSILKDVSENRGRGAIALNFHAGKEPFQANVEYSPILVESEVCAQFVVRAESRQSQAAQKQPDNISATNIETSLLDRQAITDKLQQAVESVQAGRPASTFIQINLANIDAMQDQFGAMIMDRLHVSVSRALQRVCNKDDILAKISDQSFAILSPLTDKQQLSALGKILREAVNSASVKVTDQSFKLEIYMSAIILDAYLDDASDTLSAAKSACDYACQHEIQELYISVGDSESLTGTLLDQRWARELQDAIRENRLNLLFQPIVGVAGQSEDRYQVYTQLLSKEGGKISVAELLPSIERSGISVMLDRWVAVNALKKLSEHSQKSPDSMFFIKLTAGTLSDTNFIPWLQTQCEKYQISPSRLVFDMREESIVNNLKAARDFAGRLQQLGCQIAIDAFGIGQEPDKILSMISAQYLKLNFQLMSEFKNTDPERVEIIKNISSQAKAKNTMTVAPFVDSAEVLFQIWSINSVDFVSGDFFSKPSEKLEYDFSSAAA